MPVRSLLAALGPPADATHLVFEGADGYRSVVPIADALRGIVALDRLDEVGRRLPRFVAPGLDGAKLVGPLRTVAAIVVAAGEDPVEVADADA